MEESGNTRRSNANTFDKSGTPLGGQMDRLARILALLVLVAGLALLGGCSGDGERTAPSAEPAVSTTEPQRDLDRLYALDEPVRVGAYEIAMTRVRFITDPDEETGLALRPDIAPGMAQLDVEITVRNPAGEDGEALPQPSTDGAFRLVVDDGTAVESLGVGSSPPPADPVEAGSPFAEYDGNALSREIEPGDVMGIYPQYLVSANGDSLTLEYAPFRDDPDTVVRFEVR